jgi:TonB-dependent SusC/RagA subfamily outer membrane receptor
MNTKYLFIIFSLVMSQALFAQKDTIMGVLFDANQKIIKNYPVTLGEASPVTVKTDKYGIFTFPNADLQETLYIGDKKGRNPVAIPVNGYRFITIQSRKGNFDKEYHTDMADQIMRQIQQAEADRNRRSGVMGRAEIAKSGCRDVACLLRRFSGVTVGNNAVIIRGTSTLQGPAVNNALIVIDGIPGGSIDSVMIDDVEEISVLKDASMYGSRGANGAVVINTRK